MLFCLDKHLLKPNILSDSFGLNLNGIEKLNSPRKEKLFATNDDSFMYYVKG